MSDLIDELKEEHGCDIVSWRRRKHIVVKFLHRATGEHFIYTFPCSPSDYRTSKNIRSQFRLRIRQLKESPHAHRFD